MDISELTKQLCQTDAPSGFEKPITELAAQLLEPYVDEIRCDAMGNLIAEKRCGRTGATRVLLDAHVDEVGLIITGSENGFLRFSRLGGVNIKALPASMVKILTDPPVYGVIDVLPPHVLSQSDSAKSFKIEELFIDAGGVAVPVGTPVTLCSDTVQLNENALCGKALDDRICLAAIICALDKLGNAPLDIDLVITATVQEEAGVRGARTVGNSITADYSIIMDTDFGDQPDVAPHQSRKLGDGPTIAFGPNTDREFTQKIIAIAKENDIKHTVCVEPGDSGTNARELQVGGHGARTALLGVPTRYMHSPAETVDKRDAEALAELIICILRGGFEYE